MTKQRRNLSRPLVLVALCVGANVIASFIAIGLRLPVYFDTVGTIFVAAVLGGPWAVVCALLSSLCNASYDPFALPFAPQGVTTALVASVVFRWPPLKHCPRLLKGALIALPAALVGATIAAFVFAGVTSAGSSYILQILHIGLGVPLVAAAFAVQLATDWLDKSLIVFFVVLLMRRLPARFFERFADI